MPKVRLSHFISKNIPVTAENSLSFRHYPESNSEVISQSISGDSATNKNCLKSLGKRKQEILETSIEKKYVSIPKKSHSESIQKEISKLATAFRDITNKHKKTQKRITPVHYRCPK